jgi:hypothetical protein
MGRSARPRRQRIVLASVSLTCGAVAVSGMLPPEAAAGALTHACIGRNGVIRIAPRCRPGESAVGLQVVPLAHAASTPRLRAHSITGRQVKVGSLPGSDITPGTLRVSALKHSSVGSGLSLSGGVLSVNPLLLSPFQRRITGSCGSGNAIGAVNADGSVACRPTVGTGGGTVTALAQGPGISLSPNPLVSTGTIAANFTTVQARVSQGCQSGQAISAIGAGGSVTCETAGGTVTSLSQGNGIVLTPNPLVGSGSVSADTSVLQARILQACSAGDAITAVDQAGTPTCDPFGNGTVTQVNSGNGLTGGPITGTGSLSADFTKVQARVSGTPCGSGKALTDIAQSGAATCSTVEAAYGQVNSNGSLASGSSGVSSSTVGTGVYCVSPATPDTAMTVTTTYGSGLAIPEVIDGGGACITGGAGVTWEIVMLNGSGTQVNAPFNFIIAAQ